MRIWPCVTDRCPVQCLLVRASAASCTRIQNFSSGITCSWGHCSRKGACDLRLHAHCHVTIGVCRVLSVLWLYEPQQLQPHQPMGTMRLDPTRMGDPTRLRAVYGGHASLNAPLILGAPPLQVPCHMKSSRNSVLRTRKISFSASCPMVGSGTAPLLDRAVAVRSVGHLVGVALTCPRSLWLCLFV